MKGDNDSYSEWSSLQKVYHLLAMIVPIGAIVFLTMLFCGKYFATERVEPNVFSIELTAKGLDNADSLNANVRQLQELLAELQRQEQTINQKYEQILQAKENESKTIELLSIIVAVLVAVAGFYGFKTMADICNGKGGAKCLFHRTHGERT